MRARGLLRRLGYPSDAALISSINHGAIIESNVTAEDVRLGKYLRILKDSLRFYKL
jgi:hypothetical protein